MTARGGPSRGPLWAIASYFNPASYRRRLDNYRVFRRRLGVPLLTVELSFAGAPELGADDADILVQISGGDVMWQKERLLNVALRALPDGCDKVAWLDGDVLFGRSDWGERLDRALDGAALVQLFRHAHYLGRDAAPEPGPSRAIAHSRPSLAAGVAGGMPVAACLVHPSPAQRPGTFANGLAWAARRELLDGHRLYDASIIGGGDQAIACAAYGCFDHEIERHALNARQQEHYLAWAVPFHRACRGAVAVLDGDLYHLWHGEIADRGLGSRHARFQRFQFDPFRDIALDARGSWRWDSAKPEMHAYVAEYFLSRREDG